MVMAFDKRDPSVHAERWLGKIFELEQDGGFNGFIGKPEDGHNYGFEPELFIVIPLKNVIEAERHRIGRSALFYCDVELDGKRLKNIRGIEFIEEEPLDPERIRRDAERVKQAYPKLFRD